ncbi:flavodoxin family protein [Chloroflexota bacterium]
MTVLAIVGSPRKKGNTEILTNHALKAIEEEGINTKLIRLAGLDIRPCNGCCACVEAEACTIKDDLFPIYLEMKEADGIILASPVYYGSATGLMKSFIERTGYINRHNGEPFQRKVGGPLVVARRAGHNFALAEITFWFQVLGLIVPGSSYWNMAFGKDKGDVLKDEEGMNTAWNFGKNIAWLIKKLN